MFINQSPEIWDVFQKLPEKVRKRGYENYTHMFSDPSTTSREKCMGRPPILLHICGRGPGVMVKCVHNYISRVRRKGGKGNRGHHNFPEIGGQMGKVL